MKIPEGQEKFHRRPAPERNIEERGQQPGDSFAAIDDGVRVRHAQQQAFLQHPR